MISPSASPAGKGILPAAAAAASRAVVARGTWTTSATGSLEFAETQVVLKRTIIATAWGLPWWTGTITALGDLSLWITDVTAAATIIDPTALYGLPPADLGPGRATSLASIVTVTMGSGVLSLTVPVATASGAVVGLSTGPFTLAPEPGVASGTGSIVEIGIGFHLTNSLVMEVVNGTGDFVAVGRSTGAVTVTVGVATAGMVTTDLRLIYGTSVLLELFPSTAAATGSVIAANLVGESGPITTVTVGVGTGVGTVIAATVVPGPVVIQIVLEIDVTTEIAWGTAIVIGLTFDDGVSWDPADVKGGCVVGQDEGTRVCRITD